jgi:hypothetical protein
MSLVEQSYESFSSEFHKQGKSSDFVKKETRNSSCSILNNFHTEMSLDDLINVCSLILEKIINYNELYKFRSQGNLPSSNCVFDSEELSNCISLTNYIRRISRFIEVDKLVLILSMMNLDKFLEHNSDFILSKQNCHK